MCICNILLWYELAQVIITLLSEITYIIIPCTHTHIYSVFWYRAIIVTVLNDCNTSDYYKFSALSNVRSYMLILECKCLIMSVL